MFELVSKFTPSGDQPEAIHQLVKGVNDGKKHQVLLGATGTGKTFTIANVIKETGKQTLVLAHNKTLAGQLYSELKELFPNNHVEYFVSYYDYYQPEAYVPSSDTYIEKDAQINDEIDELRHSATSSLLSYVSGMNKKSIEAILNERDAKGRINSREEIKNIKGITPKVYEQAIGFIRVIDGDNPLDKTGIHPESYKETETLLKSINMSKNDIGTNKLKDALKDFDINKYCEQLKIDKYTLTDIVNDLVKPNRDPRDDMPRPVLRDDLLKIEDLKIGDKLQGTVRNVVDFGAFIDIGLHNDGLAHISKLSREFVKNPSDVVSVGDIVDCYVVDISLEKEKVSLSLFKE